MVLSCVIYLVLKNTGQATYALNDSDFPTHQEFQYGYDLDAFGDNNTVPGDVVNSFFN